jgi:hypothetical protein
MHKLSGSDKISLIIGFFHTGSHGSGGKNKKAVGANVV